MHALRGPSLLVRAQAEGDVVTSPVVLTRIYETEVLGMKAYHVECDCGFKSSRKDYQSEAVRTAKRHADSKHAS